MRSLKEIDVVSIQITNRNTGEVTDLGERGRFITGVDFALSSDRTYYSIGGATGSFRVKPKYIRKFEWEVLGVKNRYYKHLKRVENRKRLHEKLKKRGMR